MPSSAMPTSTSFRFAGATLAALLAACVVGACASPTGQLRTLAAARGFERQSIDSGGFRLTVLGNATLANGAGLPAELPDPLSVLHVYLEGDGRPWAYRVFVTPDPTPRQPLMLALMALDPAPSAYVGRPCYNGTAADVGCSHALWTSARYSDAVVESMTGAIRSLVHRHGFDGVRLFGHSGGGTLALLIAGRLSGTRDVVTVAGNLDPDAWTRHHRFLSLRDSLNPSLEARLDDAVRQWHLVGELDQVVPPVLAGAYVRANPAATARVFTGFSHGCCWRRIWPDVLLAVTRGDASRLPGVPFEPDLPSD